MSQDITQLMLEGLTVQHGDVEKIDEFLCKFAGMKAAIRNAEAAFKQHLLDIILETGQEIVVGQKRYYAGYPSDDKCIDIKGTLETLLTETGGDLEAVAECLCSDPFKPATTRKRIGGAANTLFKKTVKPKLEEGKAKKQLMEIDERFVK